MSHLYTARTALRQGNLPDAFMILFEYLQDERFQHTIQREFLHKLMDRYSSYHAGRSLQAQSGSTDSIDEGKRIESELWRLIEALESKEVEQMPKPTAAPGGIIQIVISVVTAPLALIPMAQSAIASSRIGKIIYESPSKMLLNQSEQVTVRISHKSLKEEILKKGLDAAKTKEGALEISDVMEVALFEAAGQQNFHIFPLNNAEQLLNKKSYTEWRFTLNAKRVGKFPMILRVSMKVHLPELGEKKKDIVTWSSSIEVDVDGEVQMENIPIKNIQWDNTFKKRLKEQIANNDFSSVFQDLANHLSIRDAELFNDLVLLQTRFKTLGNTHQLGLLSHQDYAIDFNRIAVGLVRLIDEVGSPRTPGTLKAYQLEVNIIKQASL